MSALAYLSYRIFPYTPIAPKEMKYQTKGTHVDQCIGILVANVYQPNREVKRLQRKIREQNPDVILLLETDKYWQSEMSNLEADYPHGVQVPQDDTYGMLLYSRFSLRELEVKYLVEGNVPSIHGWVQLPSGIAVRLYGLHPRPPAPTENPRTTEKDKELLMVAREAAQLNTPTIVAGDLNDVAWSYTTRLFQRIGHFLDPRKGRGFYNTFNANHWFARVPLDHVFATNHFKLHRIKRLGHIGSDHFPIYISLEYANGHHRQQTKPKPDEADLQLAEEKINQET